MKKLLSVFLICLMLFLLVACETGKKENESSNPDSGVTKTDVEGISQYKEPNFMKEAGFEVVKSDSLLDIKYDMILLNGDSTAQLDLAFSDGKIGTLLIKKTEDYIDESTVENIKIGEVEVKKKAGIDNITHYYWVKDYTFYVFSIPTEVQFSESELQKIIEGFSINVGDNY